MAAASCDENEENYDSDTCNTNRSEMDKTFLILSQLKAYRHSQGKWKKYTVQKKMKGNW